MGIEVEGVSQFDPVQDRPILRTDEGASGVGGIHVKPDVLQ